MTLAWGMAERALDPAFIDGIALEQLVALLCLIYCIMKTHITSSPVQTQIHYATEVSSQLCPVPSYMALDTKAIHI